MSENKKAGGKKCIHCEKFIDNGRFCTCPESLEDQRVARMIDNFHAVTGFKSPDKMEDGYRQNTETPQIGSILKEASETINGGRQDQYGSPEDSFQLIADYWSLYLGSQILKEDVAFMMVLLKMARQQNQHKRDNLVDAVGYLGILGDMEDRN